MSLRKNGRYKELEKLSRILHASCECRTLDERDAVIDALRPLVEQGWQIDLTYSNGSLAAPAEMGVIVD